MHLARLARLLDGRHGWRWQKHVEGNRARLILVSRRGVIWEFRLAGGAWIRRSEQTIL